MAPEDTTTPSAFDPAQVHEHLNAAEQAFQTLFAGHVPDELRRFDAFLATVRMIVNQSADLAGKGE